jgi:hypothetical protein
MIAIGLTACKWRNVMKPSINYSPSNLIETPYVGHAYTVSRQSLLQSQASEPLTQILDLFNIACLVKFLACLIGIEDLTNSLEVGELCSSVRIIQVTVRVQK